MIRVNMIVEGQSEEGFVNQVLYPYLFEKGIMVSVRCVSTKKSNSRKHKGGVDTFSKIKQDIERWVKEDPSAWLTTMFDLYAFPEDFPGFQNDPVGMDKYQFIGELEKVFASEISSWKFIPYIQLHEFEALLLCDPTAFGTQFFDDAEGIEALVQMCSEYESTELMNQGRETAPSKRIIAHIPGYANKKATAGPAIADVIGIDQMRGKCRHFNEWLSTLEKLKDQVVR